MEISEEGGDSLTTIDHLIGVIEPIDMRFKLKRNFRVLNPREIFKPLDSVRISPLVKAQDVMDRYHLGTAQIAARYI